MEEVSVIRGKVINMFRVGRPRSCFPISRPRCVACRMNLDHCADQYQPCVVLVLYPMC